MFRSRKPWYLSPGISPGIISQKGGYFKGRNRQRGKGFFKGLNQQRGFQKITLPRKKYRKQRGKGLISNFFRNAFYKKSQRGKGKSQRGGAIWDVLAGIGKAIKHGPPQSGGGGRTLYNALDNRFGRKPFRSSYCFFSCLFSSTHN